MSSNNTTTGAYWLQYLFIASSSLGLLSSLLSLLLILVTRAYRRFVHRVFLYFALASAWLCIGHLTHLADEGDQVAVLYWLFHFSYGMLACSLLILWVGTSAFATTFYKVHALREKERIIVVVVVLLPLLLCWIPPWTMIEFESNETWSNYLEGGSAGFILVAAVCSLVGFVSFLALGAVTALLCRRACCQDTPFPNHLTQSLKSILPVFGLGIWTQLVGVTLVVVFLLTSPAGYSSSLCTISNCQPLEALYILTPSISVLLLVILIVDLLFCRRSELTCPCTCRRNKWGPANNMDMYSVSMEVTDYYASTPSVATSTSAV